MLIKSDWLKIRKSSPIDLDDVISLGRKMQMRLHAIKQGRRNTNDLLQVRTGINLMIESLLSSIHRDALISQDDKSNYKADLVMYEKLQESFGKLLNVIDAKEDKITSMFDDERKETKIKLSPETLAYITELETLMHGGIYFSIKNALSKKPKDAKGFMYAVYENLHINVGIFGSDGRLKGKSTSKSSHENLFPPLSAKDLKSKEVQNKLENDFNNTHKGFEEMRFASDVLDKVN